MKRLAALLSILAFFFFIPIDSLCQSDFQSQRPPLYPPPPPRTPPPIPKSSEPVYRIDKLNEYDLELIHKLLIEKGKKGLTPVRGTHKWSLDDKQPMYYSVLCSTPSTGMVRVEIKMTKYPLKEVFIKVLK